MIVPKEAQFNAVSDVSTNKTKFNFNKATANLIKAVKKL